MDELMYEYRGKEDKLLTYLRQFEKNKESNCAEVVVLAERTNPGKSVGELMYQYRGREDEYISRKET